MAIKLQIMSVFEGTDTFSITLTVGEENEKIVNLECHDCTAASGGYKHAIVFLMWIHHWSVHPSVTEIESHRCGSALTSVGTAKKYIQCHEMMSASSIAGCKIDSAAMGTSWISKFQDF